MDTQDAAVLAARCDAVVMLTWSDWFSEPVGNRYHYATRFARHLPVIFVQPDLMAQIYYYEPTTTKNITVLHIPGQYDDTQRQILEQALAEKAIQRPLLWVYNLRFAEYVAGASAALKVLHATEAYTHTPAAEFLTPYICSTLASVQLAVCVSPAVQSAYQALGVPGWRPLLLPNGCDYGFWGLGEDEVAEVLAQSEPRQMVYEGALDYRFDCALLAGLADALPAWRIEICGGGSHLNQVKESLAGHSNIHFFGRLPLPEVRARCKKAAVGLIPYVDSQEVRTLQPLKAYEYMATGLPVVSRSGIEALQNGPDADAFFFADNVAEFAQAVQRAAPSRREEATVRSRMQRAKATDYDGRFAQLLAALAPLLQEAGGPQAALAEGGAAIAGAPNYKRDLRAGKKQDKRARRRFKWEKAYSERVDPNSRLHRFLKKLLRR